MAWIRHVLLTLAILLAFPVRAADKIADTLGLMRRLDADVAEPLQKAPQLEKLLSDLVIATAKDRFDALSVDQLRDFHEAARLTAFYANSPASVIQMRRAWDELDRRGDAPAGSADELVAMYIAARLFAEVSRFSRAHADALSVRPPAFDDLEASARHATILTVADQGARLVRQRLSWRDRSFVIVIGAPGCQFSRQATLAIESDTALSRVMARNAAWLMPQQVVRDFGAVARWNREHPQAPLSLIYRQSEWPFIHSNATPAFYFFKDGELVTSFSGWTGDEQKKVLWKGLSRAGLAALPGE